MDSGCGISTDAITSAPVQEVTKSLLSSLAPKLLLLGVLIGVAALAIFLYRRSNKKETKEEKPHFRAKVREK